MKVLMTFILEKHQDTLDLFFVILIQFILKHYAQQYLKAKTIGRQLHLWLAINIGVRH